MHNIHDNSDHQSAEELEKALEDLPLDPDNTSDYQEEYVPPKKGMSTLMKAMLGTVVVLTIGAGALVLLTNGEQNTHAVSVKQPPKPIQKHELAAEPEPVNQLNQNQAESPFDNKAQAPQAVVSNDKPSEVATPLTDSKKMDVFKEASPKEEKIVAKEPEKMIEKPVDVVKSTECSVIEKPHSYKKHVKKHNKKEMKHVDTPVVAHEAEKPKPIVDINKGYVPLY